jgi:hypothetical protein
MQRFSGGRTVSVPEFEDDDEDEDEDDEHEDLQWVGEGPLTFPL